MKTAGRYINLFLENQKKQEDSMDYTKPQVIAQNGATGSFAAGCDTFLGADHSGCVSCQHDM